MKHWYKCYNFKHLNIVKINSSIEFDYENIYVTQKKDDSWEVKWILRFEHTRRLNGSIWEVQREPLN